MPEEPPGGPTGGGEPPETTLGIVLSFAQAAHTRTLDLFDTTASRVGTLFSANIAALIGLAGAVFATHPVFAPRLVDGLTVAMFGFVGSALLAAVEFFGGSPTVPSLTEVIDYLDQAPDVLRKALVDSYALCAAQNSRALGHRAWVFRASMALLIVAISALAIAASPL